MLPPGSAFSTCSQLWDIITYEPATPCWSQHSSKERRQANTMAFQLPDQSTPFGERVARRLHNDRLIWFTTVDAKGTPQPTPVWFLWDDETSTILMYSRADARRLAHVQQNPRI